MPIAHPFFLFFAALAAGTVNSVAGGGSFISFPALLFAGIPAIPANATNTAAMCPGTIAASFGYRNVFTEQARRLLPPMIVTGIIGGVLGAKILLLTPQTTFLKLVPWLLLGATMLFVMSGHITKWVRARGGAASDGSGTTGPRWFMVAGLFLELLISIYVGYFGAGVGILFLALLAALGIENIHTMNGMKTVLVSIVNGVALVTFIVARVVVWPQAILMLVGAMTGGYAGAKFAQKMNPQHVRWTIIIIGFVMSAYFFVRS